MSKRRWTIVVVPQGSAATKIIEVSHTALKLGRRRGKLSNLVGREKCHFGMRRSS